MSATGDIGHASEGAALESHTSATGGLAGTPARGSSRMDLGDVRERAAAAGSKAGAKIAEVRDVTAERLGQAGEAVRSGLATAGEAVGSAAREVEIEEFRLRGSVAGQPFAVDLSPEEGERFLTFEVNVTTDGGDNIRISGRKRLPEMRSRGMRASMETEGERLPEGTRIESPGTTIQAGKREPYDVGGVGGP